MMQGYITRQERETEHTRYQNAILAMMIRRTMNGKRVSFDDLVGKKNENNERKIVSIEEKRRTLDDLEASFGIKAVK